MGRVLALDLRERVVAAIESGLTHREAAKRFAVGIATAGAWHRRWRATGSVAADTQGQPPRSKLDAHETFILTLVEADKDITLAEIAVQLGEDRSVDAHPSTIWHFFDKRGITFKKNRARKRTAARRCAAGAPSLVRRPA